nr:putative ribonuclease H-like domain-containing protein [Tanacetum cinerariifolium]
MQKKHGRKALNNMCFICMVFWFTNPHNTDDAAFGGKKPEFGGRKPESEVYVSPCSSAQTMKHDDKTKRVAKGKSPVESLTGYINLSAEFEDFSYHSINEVNAADSLVPAVGKISTNSTNTFSDAGPSNAAVSPTHGKSLDIPQYPDDSNMLELEYITYSDDEEDVGAEDDFTNLETTITVSPIPTTRVHKNHPVTQIIVARIEAIRLFLAYASFMGFMVYQIDVKSAFLYGTIKEEVYVYQPLRIKDPDYPDKVYKVVKALYGLHHAPRAWQKGDILLVHIYVDDIIFGFTNKDLCKAFEKLMKDKFQMSLMGELLFFLGLQVKQKPDGIFISHDKYVAKILRKFGLTDRKSASTPIDTEKPLLKDPNGEDVDMHTYRPIIGSLMYLTSSRPDIMFAVNDVMRLQALIDKKKVIITESTIRDALRLDNAESIDCLPNEEIFTELSRMGYEKPSTKLTFYKAFFSPQWKFLIHTILQCMSAKRTSWNKFSSYMASAVICLSTGRKFNFSKYILDSLVRNMDSSTKFYMVGKGFSKVDTPLFEGMIMAQQVDDIADEGAASVAVDDVPTAADELTIPLPTPTTQPPPPSQDIPSISQKLERRNKLKVSKLRSLKRVGTAQRVDTSDDTVMDDVSKQGRIIASMDANVDVTLKDVADIAKKVVVDVEIEEIEVVTTAKLMTKMVTITVDDTPITAAYSAARRRKGVVIRDPEETTTPSIIIHSKSKSKDKWKWILVEEPKPLKKQAKIEQDEAYATENMVGFKMDYFKGMKYDDIRPIFEKYFNSNVAFLEKTKEQTEEEDSRALKRTNESQAEKAAKKKKLDEEVVELKRQLQIVLNDEDDVYTKATHLARKVPVVDYGIYTENNKPYYKIIRATGSPQLFLSFISILRNFDREDLEVLWQLVKERFASSKTKNFSNEFLLTTLAYMFEKPDV